MAGNGWLRPCLYDLTGSCSSFSYFLLHILVHVVLDKPPWFVIHAILSGLSTGLLTFSLAIGYGKFGDRYSLPPTKLCHQNGQKEGVSRTKIHLDTSPFIHFDEYFRTEIQRRLLQLALSTCTKRTGQPRYRRSVNSSFEQRQVLEMICTSSESS